MYLRVVMLADSRELRMAAKLVELMVSHWAGQLASWMELLWVVEMVEMMECHLAEW